MTFNQWLKQQVERDDPVGDVARDAMKDARRKPYRGDREAWHNFLGAAGASWEAHEALDEAWDEYECSSAIN